MTSHTEPGSDPLLEYKKEGNEEGMVASQQEPKEEDSITYRAQARWGSALLGGQTWPALTEDLWEELMQPLNQSGVVIKL